MNRAALLLALWALSAFAAADAPPAAVARIEARSADMLAVGLVHGERLTLRLSRLLDNAPVRDATVTVLLRGTSYATLAEADGSFTLQAKPLALPGAAAVEIQVAQNGVAQSLKGTLQVAAPTAQRENSNSARQLWWWVLNFAVCIGFLWLYSRRRKGSDDR